MPMNNSGETMLTGELHSCPNITMKKFRYRVHYPTKTRRNQKKRAHELTSLIHNRIRKPDRSIPNNKSTPKCLTHRRSTPILLRAAPNER